MTQIEQAIAQIAELKAQLPKGACAAQIAMESQCKDEAYNEAIGILKTLLNEQNHANSAKSSKDLQEHIDECWQTWVSSDNNPIANGDLTKEEFGFYARHFAQWQKEQDQKELQLAEEHGILTGMNMEREQMMKNALVVSFVQDYKYKTPILTGDIKHIFGLISGQHVKLIIVKDE